MITVLFLSFNINYGEQIHYDDCLHACFSG